MNLSSNSKRWPPPPPHQGTLNYRIRIIGPLFAAFASALLLTACPSPGGTSAGNTSTGGTSTGDAGGTTPAKTTYTTTVIGTVRDGSTNIPLHRAKVSASTAPTAPASTGPDGAFSLQVTHSGSFTLTAAKTCYQTAPAQTITVTRSGPYNTKAISLTPVPEPTGSDRFTLKQNPGTAANPTYTLTLNCLRTVTEGEFASASQTFPGETTPVPSRLAGLPEFAVDPHSKVTAIELTGSPVTIERRAFFDHRKITGRLHIPASVESIGRLAFRGAGNSGGATAATAISLEFAPNSQLKSIGDQAFQGGAIRLVLPLPRSLLTIGDNAFHTSLRQRPTNLTIPENVIQVGNFAFGTSGAFSGTLTIESPHLVRTPALDPPNAPGTKTGRLGSSAFSELATNPNNPFSTIFLLRAVFDSYNQADLNAVFGTGGTYFDISDTEKTNALTK